MQRICDITSAHLDMGHPMIIKIRRSCELLSTDKALMRFFAAMDTLMRVQWARGWETLVAHHADMRFLSFNLISFLNYRASSSRFIISRFTQTTWHNSSFSSKSFISIIEQNGHNFANYAAYQIARQITRA